MPELLLCIVALAGAGMLVDAAAGKVRLWLEGFNAPAHHRVEVLPDGMKLVKPPPPPAPPSKSWAVWARECFSGSRGEIDAFGQATLTRAFVVKASDAMSARDAQLVPLPLTPHPDAQHLKATARWATPTSDPKTWNVFIKYAQWT